MLFPPHYPCFPGACVPKSTLNGFYPLNFANNITITKQNYLAGTCYTNTKILFLCRELLRILRCRLLRQRQKVFYEFLRTFHRRKNIHMSMNSSLWIQGYGFVVNGKVISQDSPVTLQQAGSLMQWGEVHNFVCYNMCLSNKEIGN